MLVMDTFLKCLLQLLHFCSPNTLMPKFITDKLYVPFREKLYIRNWVLDNMTIFYDLKYIY